MEAPPDYDETRMASLTFIDDGGGGIAVVMTPTISLDDDGNPKNLTPAMRLAMKTMALLKTAQEKSRETYEPRH